MMIKKNYPWSLNSPKVLVFLLFNLVLWTHGIYPAFSVIVPTFRVHTLSSRLLHFLFLVCRLTCLTTLLHWPTVAQFPTAPCGWTAAMAVVVNPGLGRWGLGDIELITLDEVLHWIPSLCKFCLKAAGIGSIHHDPAKRQSGWWWMGGQMNEWITNFFALNQEDGCLTTLLYSTIILPLRKVRQMRKIVDCHFCV